MNQKTVIFDLDGTLIDSIKGVGSTTFGPPPSDRTKGVGKQIRGPPLSRPGGSRVRPRATARQVAKGVGSHSGQEVGDGPAMPLINGTCDDLAPPSYAPFPTVTVQADAVGYDVLNFHAGCDFVNDVFCIAREVPLDPPPHGVSRGAGATAMAAGDPIAGQRRSGIRCPGAPL